MAILEKMLLKNVPEGMEYKFKSSQIQLEIQTFSSYKVHEKEFAEFTDDNTGSVVKFPIRDAKKVGDRVSVFSHFLLRQPVLREQVHRRFS